MATLPLSVLFLPVNTHLIPKLGPLLASYSPPTLFGLVQLISTTTISISKAKQLLLTTK